MTVSTSGVFHGIWRSRSVLLTGFGLVGVGAVIGAGSVYFFYIRHKLHDVFQIQSALSSQLQNLKKEVDKVSKQRSQTNGTAVGVPLVEGSIACTSNEGGGDKITLIASSSSRSTSRAKRTVRFRDGYETADEDEYVTASSDSDIEIDQVTTPAPTENLENLDVPPGVEGWAIDFLKEIDKLLDGDAISQHEAFIRLQSYKDKLGGVCGFWWRFAKATHMEAAAAGQVGDSEMKKSLTLAGCTRAEKALSLNNSSANAHKWYAITLGSKGEYVSINEKIKNGFTFKEHVDKAVKLNPKDPSLHYLLGRFCLEVSTLGWIERKIASTLFSAPPTSTPQEALQHFQASERLGKPLKDNRFFMAKSYIMMKNNEQAAYWLKMAIDMPVVSSSDKPIHEEAVKLFAKYKQYTY